MNVLSDLTLSRILRKLRDTQTVARETTTKLQAEAIEYIKTANLSRPVIKDSLLDAGYTETSADTEATWLMQFTRNPEVTRKMLNREITVKQARQEVQTFKSERPYVEVVPSKPNPDYFIKQMNQFLASAAKVGHKFITYRQFIDAAEDAWDQAV